MKPLKRPIKFEEQDALNYFRFKGFTSVVHEPDGKITPDILLDNEIAVEVRRLNQFIEFAGSVQPLENLEFNLMPALRKVINNFKGESELTSYVSVAFQRPLTVDKQLFNNVQRLLNDQIKFLHEKRHYTIGNLSFTFRPGIKKHERPYAVISELDGDGGGAYVSEILKSLRIIIPEKELKIQPHRNKYPVWWLALSDDIAYGLDEIDMLQLSQGYDVKTIFEKIIFIAPFEPTVGTELLVPSELIKR